LLPQDDKLVALVEKFEVRTLTLG